MIGLRQCWRIGAGLLVAVVVGCSDGEEPRAEPLTLIAARTIDPINFYIRVDTLIGPADSTPEPAFLYLRNNEYRGVGGVSLNLRHRSSTGAARVWSVVTDTGGSAPLTFRLPADTGMGVLEVEGPAGIRLSVPTLTFRCTAAPDTLRIGVPIRAVIPRFGCRQLFGAWTSDRHTVNRYTELPSQLMVFPVSTGGAYVVSVAGSSGEAYSSLPTAGSGGAVIAASGSSLSIRVGPQTPLGATIDVRVDSVSPSALPCGTHALFPNASLDVPLPLAAGCRVFTVVEQGSRTVRIVAPGIARDSVRAFEGSPPPYCKLLVPGVWSGDTVVFSQPNCPFRVGVGLTASATGVLRVTAGAR